MKSITKILICLAIIISRHGLSDEFQDQFKVDKDFMSRIYEKPFEKKGESTSNSSHIMNVVPFIGFAQIDAMSLSNDYFSTDYKDNIQSLPRYGLSLGLGSPITNIIDFNTYAFISMAYSYAQGSYKVRSNFDMEFTDNVSTQWIPISAEVYEGYRGFQNYFVPSLKVALGNQYVHQTGTLDGYSQSVWMPFWGFGFQCLIFSPEKDSRQSFQGIGLEVERQRSLDRASRIADLTIYSIRTEFAL